MYPPLNRCGYQTLREKVFHYDNSRALRKQLQSKDQKQQFLLHLSYTLHWDTAVIADFQQELNKLLKDNFDDHPRMKDFSIKILQR